MNSFASFSPAGRLPHSSFPKRRNSLIKHCTEIHTCEMTINTELYFLLLNSSYCLHLSNNRSLILLQERGRGGKEDDDEDLPPVSHIAVRGYHPSGNSQIQRTMLPGSEVRGHVTLTSTAHVHEITDVSRSKISGTRSRV